MARRRRSPAAGFTNPSMPAAPSAGAASAGAGMASAFTDPALGAATSTAAPQTPRFAELMPTLAAGESSLVQMKGLIERLLVQHAAPQMEGVARVASALVGPGNIQGVGYTFSDPRGEGLPGASALVVYTAEPTTEDEVKNQLADATNATDEDLDRTPMKVVATGLIEAASHRFRERPAPCGISVGHLGITYGTIGVLVRGRSGERVNQLMVLSNNHVLAKVNAGPLGAAIVQPGPRDGGTDPADRIGVLERYIPLDLGSGARNYVDCATAWVVSSAVRPEIMYLANGQEQYVRVNSQVVEPAETMQVGKSGATTQLTRGTVQALNVSVNVDMGNGATTTFYDQFSIVGDSPTPTFGDRGDSGALIWTWNPSRNPVGLLFAVGDNVTFANRLSSVLDALDVDLYV